MVIRKDNRNLAKGFKVFYLCSKIVVSVYFAYPFLLTIYRCSPTLDYAGAPPPSCHFYPQMAIPLVGLLIFAFSRWPLIGGLIAFMAGHFLYFPAVSKFSWGVDTPTYPGSMYSFLPDHGGMVFIHFELIVLLLWSLIEQLIVRTSPRNKSRR